MNGSLQDRQRVYERSLEQLYLAEYLERLLDLKQFLIFRKFRQQLIRSLLQAAELLRRESVHLAWVRGLVHISAYLRTPRFVRPNLRQHRRVRRLLLQCVILVLN